MTARVARQFRLILPLALYALFVWRMPYSMKHISLRVLDWVVPAVGLGVWAAVRRQRRESWPRTALDWPLVAWCAAATWAAFFSVNPRVSLHTVWEVWLGALVLWLLVDALRRGWGPPLWQAAYLLAGVVCVVGVAELLAWYFGWPLLPAFQQGWFAIGGLADPIPPVARRLGLALVNITAFSAFLALLVPPAICLAVSARKRDTRLGMVLWLAAALVVEVLSFSRGGFLALGVSVTFILAGSATGPGARRLWARLLSGRARLAAGLLVVVVVAALALGFLVATRVGQAGHASGDVVRLDLWRSALAMLRDHPLTGVGSGAFGTALRDYRTPLLGRDHVPTAHNLYLNTGAEAGLPGLVAGAWLLIALAGAWWRRWRTTAPGSAAWWQTLGIGSALAGLAAQSAVDTFTEPAIVLVGTLFVTTLLAPGRPADARRAAAGRVPWAIVLATLALAVAGLGWESVGSADFARSLALTARGQVDAALAAVERAHRRDPSLPAYTCHAGYLYGRQAAQQADALAPAIERYQECQALRSVPGWVDRLNLATLLWQNGQAGAARAAIEQATAQTPVEWMPWLSRGYWAESAGEWTEAASAYGQALAIDPELAGSPFWQQAERAARWDDIVAAGMQAVSDQDGDPESWRWRALLAAGQPEAVAADIRDWLALHPDGAAAEAWLGEALFDSGRPADALLWLQRAAAADPTRARTYRVLGETYLALGQSEPAVRALRTALFIEPSQPVHLALARLAMSHDDWTTAAAEYGRAMRGVTLTHSYDLVLDRWMSWPAPLPQALSVGYRQDGEVALEWGSLLEWQGQAGLAQQVYRATLDLDPFLDQVRQRVQGEALSPGAQK